MLQYFKIKQLECDIMQTSKIRILGISPNQTMKTALQKIAAERSDIHLNV